MSATQMTSHHTPSLMKSIKCFLRIEYLPFGILMPILGAATVEAQLDITSIMGLFAVAFSFHIFGMFMNDVMDLPIDRQQPGRRSYPLVRGTIKPYQVMAVALLQIPITIALLWLLGSNMWGYIFTASAFAIGAIYNVWSKTSFFPPLMDLAQAVSFGFILLAGATIFGHTHFPNSLTWSAFAIVVLWETLTNVWGGMRDIEFDARMKLNTTPIMLGVKVVNGSVCITRKLKALVYAQLTLLVFLSSLCLYLKPYSEWNTVLGIFSAVFFLGSIWLLKIIWIAAEDGCRAMSRIVMLQLCVSLLATVSIFFDGPLGWLVISIYLCFLFPALRVAQRVLADMKKKRPTKKVERYVFSKCTQQQQQSLFTEICDSLCRVFDAPASNFQKHLFDEDSFKTILYILRIDEKIQGTITIKYYKISYENRNVIVVKPGLLAVLPEARGHMFTAQCAAKEGVRHLFSHAFDNCYLFAGAIHPVVYQLFANNLQDYYPRFAGKQNPQLENMAHFLANYFKLQRSASANQPFVYQEKRASHFSPKEIERLHSKSDPAIQFYLRECPNHTKGECFIIVAPIRNAFFIHTPVRLLCAKLKRKKYNKQKPRTGLPLTQQ